jgi:predicted nucleic acid-binding protein
MGIILDTSVLIAEERRGEGVPAILERVQATHGEQDAALSVVILVEVTHGIYRARDVDARRRS